jgi:hypothetical protein
MKGDNLKTTQESARRMLAETRVDAAAGFIFGERVSELIEFLALNGIDPEEIDTTWDDLNHYRAEAIAANRRFALQSI